jgi:hypothetical protein
VTSLLAEQGTHCSSLPNQPFVPFIPECQERSRRFSMDTGFPVVVRFFRQSSLPGNQRGRKYPLHAGLGLFTFGCAISSHVATSIRRSFTWHKHCFSRTRKDFGDARREVAQVRHLPASDCGLVYRCFATWSSEFPPMSARNTAFISASV